MPGYSGNGATPPAAPSANEVERAKALFFEALDLLDAGNNAAAETKLRGALAIVPDRVSALTNLAVALFRQNKVAAASEVARRAVTLDDSNVEGWLAYASCLTEEGRPQEALPILDRMIAVDARNAEALLGRGIALARLKRREEALAAFDQALQVSPGLAEAWLSRGKVLAAESKHDLAAAAFGKALGINPQLEEARGYLVHSRMNVCDWEGLGQDWADLLAGLRRGSRVAQPFQILAIPSTPSDQLAAGRMFAPPAADTPLWRGERYQHDRIRVAYLSTDFREHAVGLLSVGLFEQHDRTFFETIAISTGPDDGSATRARLMRAFDRFIDARDKSDREIATLLRGMDVDILVDLNGHTGDTRLGVLALRPAPVQVNFLGYPGTVGASHVDYIIADPIVVPADQHACFSEKVVTLPDCYQANDAARAKPGRPPGRAAAGLPETGFVFCCFNNSFKITPEVFSVWMRLLQEVPGSVLWLLEGNAVAPANLRREAQRRGVEPDRLVFAPRAPGAEHIARHQLADLFLDTFPYNAHTTASDALWAGLPLVSLSGTTFASRVGASILHAAGLDDLVADSLSGYEALALSLARESAKLAAVKRRLAANLPTCPLFDTARYTRAFEAACMAMMQRARRGERPASFTLTPTA